MARKTSIVALHEIKEINLTPLIDLTFLLLITFIITFPMIEQGIPVNLPRGRAADLQDERARTITLDVTGQLYLDQRPVSREELAAEMKGLGAADPDVTVRVRADERIAYGRLADILRLLHEARIARLALITQEENAP